MKKSIYVIVLVVLVAGVLTGCGILPGNKTSNTGSQTNPPIRTISVNGNGQVTMIPDIAYITIGVHTEGEDVKTALAENTAQSQRVADALIAKGIEQKDIQTTAFNIYPQQQYGPQGEMLGIKYVVDNSVYISVRDLTKMGDILSTVVSSGANNINGITFDVADRTAAIAEARKKAVDNARMQAEEVAIAAGAKLGEIQNLSLNTYTSQYGSAGLKSDAAAGGSPVPVSAGQMVLTVDVYAVYELK